jgi:Icc-related predicted phosphoesterase
LRIAALADLHGHFPKDVPNCDVLVVAGDVVLFNPEMSQKSQAMDLRDQLRGFRSFTDTLNMHRIHVVYVAGNHDFPFQDLGEQWVRDSFGTNYLLDSGVEIEGVNFYGSPWQPWMGGWAFNAPEEDLDDPEESWLDEKFQQIPTGTDVLITHTPPAGFHDTVKGAHRGSISLNKHIERVEPKLCVYGHIHKPGVEFVGSMNGHVTLCATRPTSASDRRPNGHPIQVFDL